MAYTTITDPSVYSTITLYTGNGQDNRAVTNNANSGNFKPDLLWIKERSSTSSHRLFDTSRGASKRIESDTDSAETTATSNQKSFDTNGFTLGTSASTNANGDTYAAWQWKANGGTTASNTDGTITSTIQANTTAGFSIVSYSGNGVNGATVGHGLGAQPEIIFIKRTNVNASGQGSNWPVRSTFLTAQQVMYLDLNAAAGNSTTMFNNTYPNTTTFTIGDNEAVNAYQTNHSFTGTYIAYCFTSIKGYSKMGNYTGNGNTNGTFVYTGFKPAFVIFKSTTGSKDWYMLDRLRTASGNPINKILHPNKSDAESTSAVFDFLSNGFKFRNGDNAWNGDGDSYLYMAFAQNPLVATNDVIALAR